MPARPPRKVRLGWLAVLGVLALLAFALATMPAGVVAGSLGNAGFSATAYAGSIWSGQARGLAWQGAPLGDLEWTLHGLPLLTGRATGSARLVRPDGQLATGYDVGRRGRDMRLEAIEFDLPIAALDALPLGIPKGWTGDVSGRLDTLHLADGWPVAIAGTLDLTGLVAPPPRSAPVGSFRATMPHPAPQPSLSVPQAVTNLTAHVIDLDGPFSVDAQLTLSRARSFALEGTLAPRGPVPPAMERSLQLLGPADADGRRQFSVGGSL